VVNPNSTASMTVKIGVVARRAASPGTQIVAVNPDEGPTAIEGCFDGALCVPGLLKEIARGEREEVDGHIIACFDDTGLDAARALATAPVIGIGEAAFHLASLVAHRFSVVTTLSRSIATIESNLIRYGLSTRCAGVHSADVSVLSLEDQHSQARAEINVAVGRALSRDRSEAIVLGCAGMADLAAALSAEHGVPVIDGVAAAVKLVEGLTALGLRTSKISSYAPPLPERHKNFFTIREQGASSALLR
jgi:allantoin racemase